MNRWFLPVHEILMVRSAQVDTSLLSQYAGSTCEPIAAGCITQVCNGWHPACWNG
ncbi:MAG: hypothetical protein ACLRP3_08830 [Escherichia sp.]